MNYGKPSQSDLERFQRGLASALAELGAPGTAQDADALQARYLADIERGFGFKPEPQAQLPLPKAA